ncbi:MAG: hypothetical protein R6W85_03500 [Gillisia sp.]
MKKIILVFSGLVFIGLAWFLFIKKYDHQFRFETKYGPGTAYQEILNIDNFNADDPNSNVETLEKEPFKNIVQQVDFQNGNHLILDWNFDFVNDSVTRVTVNTLDKKNSFQNRLEILNPFDRSKKIKLLKSNLNAINTKINTHQNYYKITLEDTASNPASNCACITSSTTIEKKAMAMMGTIDKLEGFVENNELKLDGFPMLKVTSWDLETNEITFDFCFPISPKKDLTSVGTIQLKRIESKASLKAVFNGNYRLSHLTWLDLLEKAKRENIAVENLPLEIYYTNPRMGGEAIAWKATVFMPLIK